MVKRMIAVAALAVVGVGGPASAQQYPPAVNTVTVSDTTPCPGDTITVDARTFQPGAPVTVTLVSSSLVLAGTADANGVVALQVTLPTGTPVGEHTITATGQSPSGPLSLSARITIEPSCAGAAAAAAPTRPSGALPKTGDDSSLQLAKLGLALAAVGGVITAIAVKRRKAAAAAAAATAV
jgi:LPXTG-motif cell wall-anchored protein